MRGALLSKFPDEFELLNFALARQREAHNAADHAAVMAERAWLREWSGSDWPADGFTLEENLADLREHIRDAEAGHALGYTVFDRARTVQGSVYFYGAHLYLAGELTPKEPITRPERFLAVDYWLRSALERDPATADAFVGALQRFLDETVPDAEPVWLVREGAGSRRAACEARNLEIW